MHGKATNNSKQKGWQKTVCSLLISCPAWLEYFAHPCVFFQPRSQQSNSTKERKLSVQLFKVHPPARVLEAVEFTADEVNFFKGHSHRLSVLSDMPDWTHEKNLQKAKLFSLFQSNRTLGQTNTRANKPWALIRCRESCPLL